MNMMLVFACALLVITVSTAADQLVEDSPTARPPGFGLCDQCIESRVTRLEDQLKQLRTTCCCAPDTKAVYCTVDLAAYGYDDSPAHGYVNTSGGSFVNTYDPTSITKYRGVTLLDLDPRTCTTRNRQRFDTIFLADDRVQLLESLESATAGSIIVGVTADSTEYFDSVAFQTVARPFFTRYNMDLSSLQVREKFAFIIQKGYPKKTVFQRKPRYGESLLMKIVVRGSAVEGLSFNKV